MSIYPVHLAEWFPFGSEMYDSCHSMVEVNRCYGCGRRMRFSQAWGHHSIPWGYGEIWHNLKCLESGKIARPDKRQEKTIEKEICEI